ncbi:MAG: DNA primase, partial [Candidatus Acidiferrales bacterium]
MTEAGSFADRVKTQADIVRVVGEYVRLKKSGQNFMGLCPFHSEKSPSFAVHPVKQIYHCFGCGVGGDVFNFVMAMEKCDFREAITTVAEKCGIPVPAPKPRSPEERQATQQRTALVEMHAAAAQFFVAQLGAAAEGRAARGYLEDRSLERETIERFRIGYAPSAGDALVRALRSKFAEKLLADSGLVARDQSGRLYDRFRRRIMFPIADERGRVVAFGGRALGDD